MNENIFFYRFYWPFSSQSQDGSADNADQCGRHTGVGYCYLPYLCLWRAGTHLWWSNCWTGETAPVRGRTQSDTFFVKTRQIWGIWKLRPAYSPETPNLGQNWWCFVPCDLEIWWMTLENNRASLLCCFKLCATFHSLRWIQTGVTVRKRPIWVKFHDF